MLHQKLLFFKIIFKVVNAKLCFVYFKYFSFSIKYNNVKQSIKKEY